MFCTQIIKFAIVQTALRTGGYTGRRLASFLKLNAEIAFDHHLGRWVESRGTVGAGPHAITASYADIGVDQNDPVVALVHCPRRAGFGTGWLDTVHTGS